MGSNQQDPTSNGVNTLNARLKRLWVFFILFQVFSLCLILGSIEFASYKSKTTLAHGLTEAVSNLIVLKDYRHATEVLTTSSRGEFSKILIEDPNGRGITSIDNDFKNVLPISIKIPIFFDSDSKVKAGELVYYYKAFFLIYEVCFAWLLLLLISGWWIIRFRKNIMREYQMELDIKVAAEMSEISKQVAHDIRSPLSALNILLSGVLHIEEEQKKIIGQVAERINGIANDLLEKTQVSMQSAPSLIYDRRKIYDLNYTLEKIIREKIIQHKNDQRINIQLRTSGTKNNLDISLPEVNLERIISNLINNSVEAVENDGSIFVELNYYEKNVKIDITDFGKGIPEEVVAKFNNFIFFSYGKEAQENTGSGLGLKHAYNEIRRHGGKITIRSQLNIGTKISLEIPYL